MVPRAPARSFARPRFKYEHSPAHRSDNSIQLGGDIYGISSAIEDPEGWIWETLQLLDGIRSTEEIVEASRYPSDEVLGLLDSLHESGYLEDAAAQHSSVLSDSEVERYSRVRQFYRWIDLAPRSSAWALQEQIKASKVVVVGLGGGGSSAALALASSGVGHLHCVDFDHVELSNLARQFLYCETDIGRSKVTAAMARLRAINSDITVTGENREVVSEQDLIDLTEDADVLALCADQPDHMPHLAARACAVTATPWVLGGYIGPIVQVLTFAPGGGPCFECMHQERGQIAANAPAILDERGPPSNADVAASTSASAGLGGLLVAHAVLAHITGAPDYGTNLTFGFNLAVPDDYVFSKPQPRPDCPLCRGTGVPNEPRAEERR